MPETDLEPDFEQAIAIGAKAGVILAVMYAFWAYGAAMLLFFPLSLLVAFGFGVLPGAVWGAVSGWFVGWVLSQFYKQGKLSRNNAVLLGFVLTGGIAVVANLAFSQWLRPDTYHMFIAGPSVFYIVGGGWIGFQIYEVVYRRNNRTQPKRLYL